MKKPSECIDIQDIRLEIDQIDKAIIELLGKRFEYVKAAAKFKKTDTDVKASERVKAMLSQRRLWAKEENLSEDVIEKMYRDLVEYFIGCELTNWENHHSN